MTAPLTAPDPNRFVLMRKALRKRLGFYPFRAFDTKAKAEAEMKHWWYYLAGTKYETEFRVVEADGDADRAA